MPGFYRDKDFYLITYITGPSHIYLGLSFEGEVLDEPILIKKPAIGDCKHGGLDEEQIKNAVLEGIALGNSNFNTYLNPTKILYVENDSPQYDLYKHCAYKLVEHIINDKSWLNVLSET